MENFNKHLFIEHIVLVIKDLKRSKEFYSKIFGKPEYSDKYSFMFIIGETKLFLCLPYRKMPENDRFNPNRIGLEHLAFGVKSLKLLKDIEKHLNNKVIRNSGIHIDKHSKKEKIWFDDPDGIRLEFFLKS